MTSYLTIGFIAILVMATASEDSTNACEKCVKTDQCASYEKLSKQEQDVWKIAHPCVSPSAQEYSNNIAKGDFICCSDEAQIAIVGSRRRRRQLDYNDYGNQNNYDEPNTGYNNYPNSQNPNDYDFGNNRPINNGWGSGNGNNIKYPNQGGDYGYNPVENTPAPPKNDFNNNAPYYTPRPYFPAHGQGSRGGGNSGNQGQCPVTSFPPNPETGCCGREASDTDRIIDKPKPEGYYNNGPRAIPGNPAWPYNSPHSRFTRSVEGTPPVTVTIGDRIAGGRETELQQFPWTVLLEITFDYGGKTTSFNCGGSLLSSQYVLTAGHCVVDQGAKIVDIDIYLAEYDKRTFPKDCKNVLGQGKKCIENIVMKADSVVLHPQYDDTQLKNDIALIRIQGHAPYTDYIRPICLPTIDIDNPDFLNLRLAVAGWGRNGPYRSDVKQSTIVNLVPQEICKKSYPNLSRGQICAAGYTGEDTCKGDSGGPLMTLYGGTYEVVGVVSGKRADSRCGTSVPSLYTSVYHYRDWIQSNMNN